MRWSAAKGIGRVTARLSKSLADEIVVSLLVRFVCLLNCSVSDIVVFLMSR